MNTAANPASPVPAVIRRMLGPEGWPWDQQALVHDLHGEQDCRPPCAFHSPRPHPLAGQPIRIRADETNLALPVTERLCPHEREQPRWHPDPDSSLFLAAQAGPVEYEVAMAHDCDCCCLGARRWLVAAGEPVAPQPVGQIWLVTHNSAYEVHLAAGRARRVRGINSPTPNFGHDGRWRAYAALTPPAIGYEVDFVWGSATATRTTPVLKIVLGPPPTGSSPEASRGGRGT